ncbi:MAG: ABC transporter permease [Bryobacteraceae bacterium]
MWQRSRAAMRRLAGLLRRSADDARIDEEMDFHLEQLCARYQVSGLSPVEARRRALVAFGVLAPHVEAARDELRAGFVDRLTRDLRYGVRMFARTPMLTLAAAGTLAIGIGTTSALFGLLDALMLRKLAVDHPEQLFAVVGERPGDVSESVSYPLYRTLASNHGVPGAVAGYAYRQVPIDDQLDRSQIQLSSDDWFATVGVHPEVGTVWRSGERAVVISDALARSRFGTPRGALGATLRVGATTLAISGVMPAAFTGMSLDFPVDAWIPMALEPELDGASQFDDVDLNWVRVVARIVPPATTARTRSAVNVTLSRWRASSHALADSTERLTVITASRADAHDRAQVTRSLLLLFGLVGLVLLIACANIANLQLARGLMRRREFAVRLAMGATRWRLVRQLLTENLLLALVSGGAGFLLVSGLRQFIVTASFSGDVARWLSTSLNGFVNSRVMAFTALVSLVSAIAFGLVPALRSTRMNLVDSLRQSAAALGARSRCRSVLLIAQIAASVLLLVAAGMVANTLRRAQSIELGYRDPGTLIQVTGEDWRNISEAESRDWAQRAVATLRTIPGVTAVSTSIPAAYGRPTITTGGFQIVGHPPSSSSVQVGLHMVSRDYFAATGQRILSGRGFGVEDRTGMPGVAVVNTAAARMILPGERAVGQRFVRFLVPNVTIVGVVDDARINNVTGPVEPVVYVPVEQQAESPNPSLRTIEIRLGRGAPSLDALRRTIPTPGNRRIIVAPLSSAVGESLTLARVQGWVTGALGIAGLVLAMIGVYGLHSHFVARRAPELGLRLALGASASEVRWLVWRQGMQPVVIGAAIGLSLAVIAGTALRGAVFGIANVDLLVALLVSAFLGVVASVACLLPALRASRLSPAMTLKAE